MSWAGLAESAPTATPTLIRRFARVGVLTPGVAAIVIATEVRKRRRLVFIVAA